MLRSFVDVLTVIVMVIVVIVLLVEFTPIYRAVATIFSANVYGY